MIPQFVLTSQESKLDHRRVKEGGNPKCPSCGLNLSSGELGVRICEHCIFRAALQTPVQSIGVEQSAIPDTPEGINVLGRYVVDEEIGRGGMGVIFRCRDRMTGKTVALKRVLPEHARCPEILARFEREAQAASSLLHPHLLPIYEVGRGEDGSPFFTMELAGGGSLQQCKRRYRGRWRQIAELLSKICGAVQNAHDEGILHRDLKPGNILFNEDYEPLVADFGLAKRLSDSAQLTGSSAVLGTPNYVAPEQAVGASELTPAADVYSLGAIFYELLTGQTPFAGDSLSEVFRLVEQAILRKPRRLDPTIPKNLETICMRCLKRRPSDRYQSAQALSEDLERWLDGREIAQQSASLRLREAARIHLRALSFWVAFAVCIFGLWLWFAGPRRVGPAFSYPFTCVVAVDDLDPGSQHRELARAAAKELQAHLLEVGACHVLNSEISEAMTASKLLDPSRFGRALGADFVLSGNVRHLHDGARIVLRLVRSDTGDVVWYGCKTISTNGMADLNDLGRVVAETLQNRWRRTPLAFSRPPQISQQPNAFSFFCRAKELTTRINRRDLETAITLFRRAIALDPSFGEARSMLAYAFTTEAAVWTETDKLPFALAAARDALSCNPYSALGHRALGNYYFLEAEYPKALEELWEALQLNPSSPGANMALGDCLREMGHPGAAVRWNERAAKLDPVHSEFGSAEAESLMMLGQDDQALGVLQRGGQLDPDLSDTIFLSSVLSMWQAKYDQARKLCNVARAKAPDYPYGLTLAAMIDFFAHEGDRGERAYEELRTQNRYQQSWPFFGAINPSSALACLARGRGETIKAQRLTQEALDTDFKLLEMHPNNCRILHDISATRSDAGDSQGAMACLEKAISAGWVEHRSSANDPRFRTLAKTDAFTTLLSKTFPRPLSEGSDANRKN